MSADVLPWREGHELLADWDERCKIMNNIDRDMELRRIELEVAIGTRDTIANLVDEVRQLTDVMAPKVDDGQS